MKWLVQEKVESLKSLPSKGGFIEDMAFRFKLLASRCGLKKDGPASIRLQ